VLTVSGSSVCCRRFPSRDHRPFSPCFLWYRPPGSGTRRWLLCKFDIHVSVHR